MMRTCRQTKVRPISSKFYFRHVVVMYAYITDYAALEEANVARLAAGKKKLITQSAGSEKVYLPKISLPERQVCEHACVGGTFDHIHAGHKVLLTVAALIASKRLVCGISDGPLLANKKHKQFLEDFDVRNQKVAEFVALVNPAISYEGVRLLDPFGPTVTDPTLQIIAVSDETVGGATEINKRRAELSFPPLAVEVIHFVESSDPTVKLSSTMIRAWLEKNAQ
eukprot:Colp12_sorted_trinity150504_noHs@3758